MHSPRKCEKRNNWLKLSNKWEAPSSIDGFVVLSHNFKVFNSWKWLFFQIPLISTPVFCFAFYGICPKEPGTEEEKMLPIQFWILGCQTPYLTVSPWGVSSILLVADIDSVNLLPSQNHWLSEFPTGLVVAKINFLWAMALRAIVKPVAKVQDRTSVLCLYRSVRNDCSYFTALNYVMRLFDR